MVFDVHFHHSRTESMVSCKSVQLSSFFEWCGEHGLRKPCNCHTFMLKIDATLAFEDDEDEDLEDATVREGCKKSRKSLKKNLKKNLIWDLKRGPQTRYALACSPLELPPTLMVSSPKP